MCGNGQNQAQVKNTPVRVVRLAVGPAVLMDEIQPNVHRPPLGARARPTSPEDVNQSRSQET